MNKLSQAIYTSAKRNLAKRGGEKKTFVWWKKISNEDVHILTNSSMRDKLTLAAAVLD
jgi:hypothetical protein